MELHNKFNKRTSEGFDFAYHKELSSSGNVLIFECLNCHLEICQDPQNIDRWANDGIVCPFCNKVMFLTDFIKESKK